MSRSKRAALAGVLLLSMVLVVLFAWSGVAQARVVERVSVRVPAIQGDSWSEAVSLSADGRYRAFYSNASNLVAGDTNGVVDVFVQDGNTGAITRVSVDSAGVQGNGASRHAAISADGRYVAFYSYATNLVADDINGVVDIFVHDMNDGTTTRVSLDSSGSQVNDASYYPSISADGRYVAFYSYATNLVPGDTNGVVDIFVRDRTGGTTTLVSVDSAGVQGNGVSQSPSISADGRYVAFQSEATNLVSGDSNGVDDIFVRDRTGGTTTRVSVDSAEIQGNGSSTSPSMSADGGYVAFQSAADNLVPGDTVTLDVFVRDLNAGTTSRVSVDSAGNAGAGSSSSASISGDGRYVAFYSYATDLVAGDTNGAADVFVRDRNIGTTERVSVDSAGVQGNAFSLSRAISADGCYVGFTSDATNLVPGDTNGFQDAFLAAVAPAIDSLDPTTGPSTGGTLVTITGRNFNGLGGHATDPGAVTFGGVNAADYTVVSATEITATAPAAPAAGQVDVQVTGFGSANTTSGPANDYTYYAAYTLTYTAGADGSISGTSPQTVAQGANGTAVTAVPATRLSLRELE